MKTVIGLYKRFEDAQQVVHALRDAGFESSSINMIAGDSQGQYSRYLEGDANQREDVGDSAAKGAGVGAVLGGLGGLLLGLGALAIPGIGPVIAAGPIVAALAGAGVGAVAGGLVGALVDMGVPEEHAQAYADGVKQGGTLVTVQAEDTRVQIANEILNRYHPMDITQRGSGQQMGTMRDEHRQYENVQREQAVPVTGQSDAVLPVIQEDLLVGKREVDRGGVRVESHVTEEPVEKDINLRQERVTVERHPVDRPVSDSDISAFKEGTIEMRETSEEPVVEKRARVVEEVHVNKDVIDETHTVRDTVRKTDVEVQNLDPDLNRYDQKFRQHFQTRYGTSGKGYEYYQPAYRYGYDMANNNQYSGYDWNRLEPVARQDWERRGMQGRWEDIKDAVRGAWETTRNH